MTGTAKEDAKIMAKIVIYRTYSVFVKLSAQYVIAKTA